jgi:uncharacterized protein (DUF1501 family)
MNPHLNPAVTRLNQTVTRRRVLVGSAGLVSLGAAAGMGGSTIASLAWAIPPVGGAELPRSTGRFVVVFLRGGFDGLSAVAPAGDQHYADARPGIRVLPEQAIPLDGSFGLHPALAPLAELYQQRDLAIVHAVSNATSSRSHFQAQALVELGGQAAAGDGWITRHLATTAPPRPGAVRAVALSPTTPTSLRACPTCLAMSNVASYTLGGRSGLLSGRTDALASMYAGSEEVAAQGQVALAALAQMGALSKKAASATAGAAAGSAGAAARAGASGKASYFAAGLADAGRLLGSSELGIEVVTLDVGGWDTHHNMGTPAAGHMKDLLTDFGASLHGFWSDLQRADVKDVTVVVISEFGRRLAENGSGGLDHGHGNAMFVLGSGIKGGRVITDWPGLSPDQLDRGDLQGTIDYRDVVAELLRARGGNSAVGQVFPGRPGKPVGLV